MNEKYPELFQFFGGSFHQDWDEDFDTPEDVIRNYIRETHYVWIKEVVQELKTLLKEKHTKAEWYRLLSDDFGCSYALRSYNIEPTEWLEKVQKQLEDELVLAERKEK